MTCTFANKDNNAFGFMVDYLKIILCSFSILFNLKKKL